MNARDTTRVEVEAAIGALAAGALAAGLLAVLHEARLAVQTAVAALAPVAALAIGVSWASSDMFITPHDLQLTRKTRTEPI